MSFKTRYKIVYNSGYEYVVTAEDITLADIVNQEKLYAKSIHVPLDEFTKDLWQLGWSKTRGFELPSGWPQMY